MNTADVEWPPQYLSRKTYLYIRLDGCLQQESASYYKPTLTATRKNVNSDLYVQFLNISRKTSDLFVQSIYCYYY